MKRHFWTTGWWGHALCVAAAAVAAGCGGGGGGQGRASAIALRGTAAIGAPLLDASVEVKDRDGGVVSTRTSGIDGTFAVSVAGMRAPFLLRVDDGVHAPLFGAAAAPGTANLHPLSDLILELFYSSHGSSVPEVFDALTPLTPMPTDMMLCSLEDLITKAIGPYLVTNGVDLVTFHPLTTPFRADGTGFDAVLGTIVIDHNATGPRLVVDDRFGATECEQVSQFEVETEDGSVRIVTDVDSSKGEHRQSTDSIILPRADESDAFEAAARGIEAAIDRLAVVVNSRGASLTAADVGDFFDSVYLENGRTAAIESVQLASALAGVTMSSLGVSRIDSFHDLELDRIEARFAIRMSFGGVTQRVELPDDPVRGMVFRAQDDGRFRAFGNQQIAETRVQSAMGAIYDGVSPAQPDPIAKLELRVRASAPTGTVANVDVVGLFPPDPATDKLVTLIQQSFAGEDSFQLASPDVPWFPAAGTSYEFRVTPVSGSLATYVHAAASYTEELVRLASYDGVSFPDFVSAADYHHLAFVHPGNPLNVRWNLPATFAVSQIQAVGVADDGGFHHEEFETKLSGDATGATLTFPASLDGGGPIQFARIEVTFIGVNGELAFLRDSFYP